MQRHRPQASTRPPMLSRFSDRHLSMRVFAMHRSRLSQPKCQTCRARRSLLARSDITPTQRRVMLARQDPRWNRVPNLGTLLPRQSIGVISVVLGVGFLGNPAAFAQSADAEALFDQGNKLMADGKLAQACDSFEASNRIEPRAGTLLQLGE